MLSKGPSLKIFNLLALIKTPFTLSLYNLTYYYSSTKWTHFLYPFYHPSNTWSCFKMVIVFPYFVKDFHNPLVSVHSPLLFGRFQNVRNICLLFGRFRNVHYILYLLASSKMFIIFLYCLASSKKCSSYFFYSSSTSDSLILFKLSPL